MGIRNFLLLGSLMTGASLIAGVSAGPGHLLVQQSMKTSNDFDLLNASLAYNGVKAGANGGSFSDYSLDDGIVVFQQTLSDRRYSIGRMHKYFGYGTLIAAGITAISSENESLHCGAAHTTAVLAAGSTITGVISYGSRLSIQNGILQRENLHWILGSLGAICCTASVIIADLDNGGGHSGLGMAGGVLMYIGFAAIAF